MTVIYLCPVDKRLLCSWEGYASDIKQHFEKEHNGLLFHTNSVEIDLNILHENRLLYLDEEMYLIQSDIENNKLHLKLRYLGSSSSALKFQYEITIGVNNIVYKYDSERFFSCILPTNEGWQVNLTSLENFHGKLASLTCTLLIKNQFLDECFELRSRKHSDISLKINNNFIERNVCDDIEENYLDALSLLDGRLKELKCQKADRDSDIMDKISHLNLSILEEPFSGRNYNSEDYKSEFFADILPEIPEKLDLTCTSCGLDMLPPIYLCISGHNICNWCKGKNCKLCGGVVTFTRNIDLENTSRTHKHNCRYFNDGCNEKLFYNEVRSHEARCSFCKYKCMSGCALEAKFQDFVNHLKIVHGSIKLSFSLRNEFPKDTDMHIANQSIGIFYCKSEQDGDFIIWKVIFCGPKERQFFCELSFKGSKYKEAIFMNKGSDNTFKIRKSLEELKRMKAKPKYATLTITSYDN